MISLSLLPRSSTSSFIACTYYTYLLYFTLSRTLKENKYCDSIIDYCLLVRFLSHIDTHTHTSRMFCLIIFLDVPQLIDVGRNIDREMLLSD